MTDKDKDRAKDKDVQKEHDDDAKARKEHNDAERKAAEKAGREADGDPQPEGEAPPNMANEGGSPVSILPSDAIATPLEGEPRVCGALPGKEPSISELIVLINESTKAEIVPSDGAKEVLGLGPLIVTGAPWRPVSAGLKLEAAHIEVVGPSSGPVEVWGYGLFLDDVQQGWNWREDAMRIAPGQHFVITDDIVMRGEED